MAINGTWANAMVMGISILDFNRLLVIFKEHINKGNNKEARGFNDEAVESSWAKPKKGELHEKCSE
ncbi:hypothetical protein JXO52_13190 [bacterium]|nr:hypothetical protein [bacterium]